MSDGIYSRVTIIDRATLFVTESQGDFPSTVLEDVVKEQHVPAFTHNPPTVIVLESGFNKERDHDLALVELTPLARAVYDALLEDLGWLERSGSPASGDAS